MKLSDELVQGFALGESALKAADERLIDARALAEDKAMLTRDLPGLKIGYFNDYAGLRITFPANISHENFERMKAEIQAAIDQAERRGEQKALAFLMGEGSGTPVGIVGQPEELTETGRGSFTEFIREFAKALEFMNTMLGIAVQEFSADRESNDGG